MGESILEVKQLNVELSGNTILDNLSFKINEQSPFAIIGESGSGKSTLLLSIAQLIPIKSGKILANGIEVKKCSIREIAGLVGLVFQDFALFPHFSVSENICFAARRHHMAHVDQRCNELSRTLGIDNLLHRRPHEISGGQKQRVAIARSLILKPRILLFDEPSSALDDKSSDDLAHLLMRLNQDTQIVVVSHDISFVKKFCRSGCLISGGKMIKQDELGNLIDRKS